MNWETAAEIWSTVRSPADGKPLGNNTRLWWSDLIIGEDDNQFIITLHGNEIIRILEDDSQVLDSCGWKTITTKDRINKWGLTETYFEPGSGVHRRRFYLFQRDFQWYIRDMKFDVIERFYDGIIVYPDSTEVAKGDTLREIITFNFPEGVI